MKKSFFSARKITCIDDVWRSLPGWVARQNQRIHSATYHVPDEIFANLEKETLRPILPSVYETSPTSFTAYQVQSMPYIQYKTCKYSVPQEYTYHTVKFKVVGEKIHIYDQNQKFICTHTLSACKGSINQLPEHRRKGSDDWMYIAEDLRKKWNCQDFQHFINGFKKENNRYLSEQLSAVKQFLDEENPDRSLVAEVMKVCCEKLRYKFSQFKETYYLVKAGRAPDSTDAQMQISSGDVQHAELAVYADAVKQRTVRKEATL